MAQITLWLCSTERLARRLRAGEETISFDKDDDETLDFVTAAANLRSAAYGIQGKSRWEVKGEQYLSVHSVHPARVHEMVPSSQFLFPSLISTLLEMAGNIIPAIATTNAIISGLIVLQALHLLRKSYHTLKNVHLQFKPTVPLSSITLSPPNPQCGVCRDVYSQILCDPARVTLGEVIDELRPAGTEDREVSTYEDKRMLSDPDFDDNLDRTLESLSVTAGKFLSIVDEDGEYETITIAVGNLP